MILPPYCSVYSAESASVRDVSTARSTDRQASHIQLFMPSLGQRLMLTDMSLSPSCSLFVGAMRRIFMRDTDASSFFNQRSQRWAPSQHEIGAWAVRPFTRNHSACPKGSLGSAEQRQRATAVGRRRDYIEEQRNRLENIAEEQRDVQGERSHERVEQWKEFNYDGLFPSSMFSRFYI
ncbi:hypothetical protein JZ751_022302 [Albula glossodonta]|uniref:Unique cartilage matrix-associated protein n=1 Tax=Albula glossodonta TaxID=121402 RepID=A0A8T2NJX5_9TELE|nr:hypothetical protein JZ751_022302 [Albula glossodonta]